MLTGLSQEFKAPQNLGILERDMINDIAYK